MNFTQWTHPLALRLSQQYRFEHSQIFNSMDLKAVVKGSQWIEHKRWGRVSSLVLFLNLFFFLPSKSWIYKNQTKACIEIVGRVWRHGKINFLKFTDKKGPKNALVPPTPTSISTNIDIPRPPPLLWKGITVNNL